VISQAHLRGILDSRGSVTVEAELTLADGAQGWGSVPRAIAPGRRERRRSAGLQLGPNAGSSELGRLAEWLRGSGFASEEELDAELTRRAADFGVGADATLAVSQAIWRAAAASIDQPLYRRLATSAGCAAELPRLLVNVFSGGVHLPGPPESFQAVMAIPQASSALDDVTAVLTIWERLERRLDSRGARYVLAASSGICLEETTSDSMLWELADEIAANRASGIGMGVDVAAEHLIRADGRYRLDGRVLAPDELLERIAAIAERYRPLYLEDPFSPEDETLWAALTEHLSPATLLVGDDLFATDPSRLDASLAGGVLIKPVQTGTVAGALETARKARAAGIVPCVSHRSGETEDTFVCDLAVAVGARFQKIGGPRRGDRIAKYNRLLKIAEELDAASPGDAEFESTITTDRTS
jgi:enolase 1/2/3